MNARSGLGRVVVAVGLAFVASGAQAQTSHGGDAPVPYRLQVGDDLDIRFPYAEELNFAAPVRPDGAIAVPYVGDVMAAGRTPGELREAIRGALTSTLRDPEVTVIVRTFRTQRVFVTGEVGAPGVIEFRPGLTALHALAAAGGYRETASRQVVLVMRPNVSGDMAVTALDVRAKGARIADLALQPSDIVLVPRSGIAKVNQAIRQYVRGVLPVGNLGLFFDLVGSTGATVGFGPGS